jgi:beta-glucuronidase
MIRRDKNHACVIAWSLLNEPETNDDTATPYFEDVFAFAHECDPQKRPRTFALIMNSRPETCRCHQIADFLSFNRYYGWYVLGGPDIEDAEMAFRGEMDAWMKLEPNKPMIFTEYGADTHSAIDKIPSVMWSESYQIEMLAMCERVFDSYDAIVGEQVWNFADFQTTEGIMRVDGNKKGIFTRQRQPKRAAFHLKERWENKI